MSSNGSGSKRLRIARRAIRRMEPFDRAVFLAIRFENAGGDRACRSERPL